MVKNRWLWWLWRWRWQWSKGGGEPSWAESAEDQEDFQEDFLPLPHSFPQDHAPFDGSWLFWSGLHEQDPIKQSLAQTNSSPIPHYDEDQNYLETLESLYNGRLFSVDGMGDNNDDKPHLNSWDPKTLKQCPDCLGGDFQSFCLPRHETGEWCNSNVVLKGADDKNLLMMIAV